MLRRIRTGLKLSQTEVSSGTELAHCTISSHENGHNIPFKTTLKIYASFFAEKMQEKGVDISEVLR